MVNLNYQKNYILYQIFKIILSISFGNLLEISPTNFIPLRTFNSEFSYIEIWFTYQNSQPLEIEDRINFTLAIK